MDFQICASEITKIPSLKSIMNAIRAHDAYRQHWGNQQTAVVRKRNVARIEEVIAAVNRLEDLASVRELMDMLRRGSSRARGERAA